MISPVIETHAAVMPRKCTRATILTADSRRRQFPPRVQDTILRIRVHG